MHSKRRLSTLPLVSQPSGGGGGGGRAGSTAPSAATARHLAGRKSFGTAYTVRAMEAASSGGSTAGGSDISSLYTTVVKLSAENKITAKNTWSLPIIDHMDRIIETSTEDTDEEAPSQRTGLTGLASVPGPAALPAPRSVVGSGTPASSGATPQLGGGRGQAAPLRAASGLSTGSGGGGGASTHKMLNFQRASCALDASVKVYACRVDDVYSTSYRVWENLSRNDGAPALTPEDAARQFSGDADEDADEEDERSAGAGSASGKRGRRHGGVAAANATIERNRAAITLTAAETKDDVDPLFRKMAASFDESGVAGMLLNRLSAGVDATLQFDSAALADMDGMQSSGMSFSLTPTGVASSAVTLPPTSRLHSALDGLRSSASRASSEESSFAFLPTLLHMYEQEQQYQAVCGGTNPRAVLAALPSGAASRLGSSARASTGDGGGAAAAALHASATPPPKTRRASIDRGSARLSAGRRMSVDGASSVVGSPTFMRPTSPLQLEPAWFERDVLQRASVGGATGGAGISDGSGSGSGSGNGASLAASVDPLHATGGWDDDGPDDDWYDDGGGAAPELRDAATASASPRDGGTAGSSSTARSSASGVGAMGRAAPVDVAALIAAAGAATDASAALLLVAGLPGAAGKRHWKFRSAAARGAARVTAAASDTGGTEHRLAALAVATGSEAGAIVPLLVEEKPKKGDKSRSKRGGAGGAGKGVRIDFFAPAPGALAFTPAKLGPASSAWHLCAGKWTIARDSEQLGATAVARLQAAGSEVHCLPLSSRFNVDAGSLRGAIMSEYSPALTWTRLLACPAISVSPHWREVASLAASSEAGYAAPAVQQQYRDNMVTAGAGEDEEDDGGDAFGGGGWDDFDGAAGGAADEDQHADEDASAAAAATSLAPGESMAEGGGVEADAAGAATSSSGGGAIAYVQAARVVERIGVKYETVSKRVDVQRLKSDMTHAITTLPLPVKPRRAIEAELRRRVLAGEGSTARAFHDVSRAEVAPAQPGDAEAVTSGSAAGTTPSFTSLVRDMHTAKPDADVSVAFYFITLLHLANETGLTLAPKDGPLDEPLLDFSLTRVDAYTGGK